VEIELICEDDLVSLSVHDNGTGFDQAHLSQTGAHLGLLSMKERVRLAKGRFEIDSTPAKGTHVQVELPLTRGTPHV
jgi:signal transduction histidine kinase